MSTIFNKHTSVVYESKGKNKTAAFEGQRLVVSIAKVDGDKNYHPNLQQTMATSVPVLTASHIDWQNVDVQTVCTSYFQTVQNALIVDRIKATGTHTHTDAEIGIDALLEFLDRESAGDTWDVERVAGWFTDNLSEYFGLRLIEKFPDMDNGTLETRLVGACESFSIVLGSKKRVSVSDATKILNVLKLIPEDKRDRIARRFIDRVDAVVNPKASQLADALDIG